MNRCAAGRVFEAWFAVKCCEKNAQKCIFLTVGSEQMFCVCDKTDREPLSGLSGFDSRPPTREDSR